MYFLASWMYNELQLLSHRHSASRSQSESFGDSRTADAGKKTSDGVSLKTRSCHIQHCIYGMPSFCLAQHGQHSHSLVIHSLIHSPIHSLVTRSPIHSLIHSCIHSLMHSRMHSLTRSLAYYSLITRFSIQSRTHSFTRSLFRSHSLTRSSLTYSFTHTHMRSLIHAHSISFRDRVSLVIIIET